MDVPISGDAPQESDAEVFHRYFPTGRIEPITQLPEAAMSEIDVYAHYDEHQVFDANKFDQASKITHHDGTYTLVARYSRNQDLDGDPLNPQSTYLIDFGKDGQINGTGFMSSLGHSLYKGKPFVGYTDTLEEFRKHGLGRRRLLMMNALSQMIYRLPLHSGLSPSVPARRVWERLVSEGVAIRSSEAIQGGYVFLPK